MLEKMIAAMNRETLVQLLSDETVPLETLRLCVCAAMGGDLEKLGAAQAEVPPPAVAAPAAPAGGKKKTGNKAKSNGAAASNGAGNAADTAVASLLSLGKGFAISDVVTASGASKAQAGGAIKRAIEAGKAHSFGERRYMRYGKTEAIAKKASEEDRAG